MSKHVDKNGANRHTGDKKKNLENLNSIDRADVVCNYVCPYLCSLLDLHFFKLLFHTTYATTLNDAISFSRFAAICYKINYVCSQVGCVSSHDISHFFPGNKCGAKPNQLLISFCTSGPGVLAVAVFL